MINLTDLEKKMMKNIRFNHYLDQIQDPIWNDCWDCGPESDFCSPKQASGILASLTKKNIIDGNGETFYLTEFGVEICNELFN